MSMAETLRPDDLGNVLAELFAVVEQRKHDSAQSKESYTVKLLTEPEDKLLKKIGEEATEVVMAAKDCDQSQLRHEIADLLYHLMVVMVRHGLTLDDIACELAGRRK